MTKKKKIINVSVAVATVLWLIGSTLLAVYFGTLVAAVPVTHGFTMPVLDFDETGGTSVAVDNPGTYLAHPDLVMADDGTLITMYPQDHGKGPIAMKISEDFGLTWSDRVQNTPASWEESQETPTLYNISFVDAEGAKTGETALILVSGCPYWHFIGNRIDENGFNFSVSTDDGDTWSEFRNMYGKQWAAQNGAEPYDCIVAMSSLTQVKENGKYVNKWMGTFHDHKFYNYKTYLTFETDKDGSLKTDSEGRYIANWSEPEYLIPEWRKYEKLSNICEVEIIRTPSEDGASLDGDRLVMITRANSRKTLSLILISDDEGKTWSEPRELPPELNGDRHKAEYDPVTGKLVISFRQITSYKKSALSVKNTILSLGWVGWVGTFDQLLSDGKGDALVVLGASQSADCGYAGTVCKDGQFVMISYGIFDGAAADQPYIMAVRFNLEFLNRK